MSNGKTATVAAPIAPTAMAAPALPAKVAILDTNAEAIGPEKAAERAVEMRPRLVAVPVYGHQPSASTQVMPAARALVNAIKDLAPDLPVILVGGHVAALPERTLAEERCDWVADGEGLHTLVDLLSALASVAARAKSELASAIALGTCTFESAYAFIVASVGHMPPISPFFA